MVKILKNVRLAPFTVYQIGGPARYFVEARNSQEIKEAVIFAAEQKMPFFILGAGSNILVSDDGFEGVAVHIINGRVEVEDNYLIADAGVMMARAVLYAANNGLKGFEWGVGIPGTIGGSVRGNAGCFGGEVKDIVKNVDVIRVKKIKKFGKINLEEISLNNLQCRFGYRDSIFKYHPELVILRAKFLLQKGNPQAIKKNIQEIMKMRVEKQDIGQKCAGCIFKNILWSKVKNKDLLLKNFPELKKFSNRQNIPTSFLIDNAGLKGKCRGNICISEKHANFFINKGGGSAFELKNFINEVKLILKKKYNLVPEEEIQYVGF